MQTFKGVWTPESGPDGTMKKVKREYLMLSGWGSQ